MNTPPVLSQLSADQLCQLAAVLMSQVEQQEQALKQALEQSQKAPRHSEQRNQQLTHELALLKRHQFCQRSEHLNVLQISLLEKVVDAAIEAELETLVTPTAQPAAKQQPKRTPLPAELPRIEIRHDPANEHCACGCELRRIGEEVSEKQDYTPGVFTVERQ